MPTPDDTRMSDDEFRQLAMRTLGEHDTRMAAHDARMTRMDRQYETLLEVQLDQARSHDEHVARMDELQRLQRSQTETLEQMRLTLDAIKEILRDRRN